MFAITITEKSGAQRQVGHDASELTIGRVEGNDLVLAKNNVSKQHARLALNQGRYVLSDLDSTNGTYVNGRRISGPVVVEQGDKIYIGDFILSLDTNVAREALHAEPAPSVASAGGVQPGPPVRARLSPAGEPAESGMNAGGRASARPDANDDPQDTGVGAHEAHGGQPAGLHGGRSPMSSTYKGLGAAAVAQALATGRTYTGQAARQDKPSQVGPIEVDAQYITQRQSAPPVDPPAPSEPPSAERAEKGRPAGPVTAPPDSDEEQVRTSPVVLAPSVRLQSALSTLMERLGAEMDITAQQECAFPADQAAVVDRLLAELDGEGALGADLDRRFLRDAMFSEAVGLGPLDRLLSSHAVREVIVDGPDRLLADLGGGLSPVSSFFSSRSALAIVVRRLLSRAGERPTEAPIQRAVLPDGGQLVILRPPLAPRGPLVTVRRPATRPVSPDALVTEGRLSREMLQLLRVAVGARRNLLVTGPAGSGVTEVLGALGGLAADHERVLAIEAVPGLCLDHPQVTVLSRVGAPEASLAAVLASAEHVRHDRLLMDDVRPADALAALSAAASAQGVLIGMHAPSPTHALSQLELFARMALGGSSESLAFLLTQAVQLLVHVQADRDGTRRIETIAEVQAAQGERVALRPLFRYDGGFRATDHRPSFLTQ